MVSCRFSLKSSQWWIYKRMRGGASPGASRVASLRSKVSPLGMLKFFSSCGTRMERDGTGSSMAILRVKNGDWPWSKIGHPMFKQTRQSSQWNMFQQLLLLCSMRWALYILHNVYTVYIYLIFSRIAVGTGTIKPLLEYIWVSSASENGDFPARHVSSSRGKPGKISGGH